jgi:signal peptidase II
MTGPIGDAPRTGAPRVWLWAVAAVWLAVDQLTKRLIVTHMAVGDSHPVIAGVLSITRRTNTGGAFGILPGSTLLLSVVGALVMIFLLIYGPGLVGRGRLTLLGLGMVVGGAAGNLLDRARTGHVVDFIDFHIWPTFNVADIGITVGVALLILVMLLERPDQPPQAAAPDESAPPSA